VTYRANDIFGVPLAVDGGWLLAEAQTQAAVVSDKSVKNFSTGVENSKIGRSSRKRDMFFRKGAKRTGPHGIKIVSKDFETK
jgi:hypothetical protein